MARTTWVGIAAIAALAAWGCSKQEATADHASGQAEAKPAAAAAAKTAARGGGTGAPSETSGSASGGTEAARDPAADRPTEADVRPPTAADLADYVKDLEGDGPLTATFETSMGAIHCELFEKQTPMTVANFVGLARGLKAWKHPGTGKIERRPFYDGLVFHRVIPNFMIQGGDPLGIGRGGPGYQFADEFVDSLRHDRPGRLSMANAGPGTNGSQFFITEVPTPHLDGRHTIFGQCDDIDVVKRIAREGRVDKVKIEKVTIARGGK
ncbi:MAG: peptidylprolyl isomerase [Deltaproteobacteria bacterium]|nr:MAG: peptidylprolyl isomerase [Deltaproteobacteria bacterium]